MITLNKKQVLMLHKRLIETTGGSMGIRNEELLDSALSNPFQSFDGKDLYPTVRAKAAQLCFGLVKNHAMHGLRLHFYNSEGWYHLWVIFNASKR